MDTSMAYLKAFVIASCTFVVLFFTRRFFIKRLYVKHSERNSLSGIFLNRAYRIPWYFFVGIGLFAGSLFVTVPVFVTRLFNIFFVVFVGFEFIRLGYELLIYFLFPPTSSESDLDKNKKSLLTLLIKIILWITGILLILLNLGVEITPLLASLGIGGIAIGFALQNILSDIFSSFTILLEKPFKIGDFIKFGDKMGIVMDVSLKATRIKSLDGEVLVVPNKEVIQSIIFHNYSGVTKRRVAFKLSVVYETPLEKLQIIPTLVENCVKQHNSIEFWRCVFNGYGAYSLDFEVVYFVETLEYKDFLLIKQAVNYAIFAEFSREGIRFAYQTVRVISDEKSNVE